MKVKAGSEDEIHIRIAQMMDKEFPHLLWMHVPNGEKRSMSVALKLKAMGVKRGVPDILIFDHLVYEKDHYRGLAVELKSKSGIMSDYQIMWMKRLARRDWLCKMASSLDEFRYILQNCEFYRIDNI